MRLFSYKLVRDFGFAPNPFGVFCTLATCKPQIRRVAVPGDLIIGCGSLALGNPERIIFAMRVSEKLTFGMYWEDPRFTRKKPSFLSSRARGYGDNIYREAAGGFEQEDSHHSYEGGATNELNLVRDTSANAVLVGSDFVYWGRDAVKIPAHMRNFNGEDLYPPRRSHRSRFSTELVATVDKWFRTLPEKGFLGRPTSWDA